VRYAALRTLIAIALGIIVAEKISIPLIYLIIGIIVGIIFDRLTKGYSLYWAIFFAAMLNCNIQKPNSIAPLYNRPVKIIGLIIDEPVTRQQVPRYQVALKNVFIGEKKYSISGKLFAQPKQTNINLRYGDVIVYQGSIKPFNFPSNPNLLDLNKFYHRRGVLGQIRFFRDNVTVIGRNQGNPIAQYLIFPLRRYFFKVINHYLTGPTRALYAGILLGEKQDLPKATKLAFSNTGLAHILAVSGLNVGILVGVCILLFSVTGLYRGKWYTLLVLGIIVFLYVGVTGFEPSAVRAGLMSFLCSLGFFLERKIEPLQGVFIAGIIILLLSPVALFEIGFQLSFAATIALILFAPKIYQVLIAPIRRRAGSGIRKYLFAPLSVVIAAQLGVGPLLVYYFFKISVITILANLLVVPLVGFATPLAFVVAFFHLFAPFLAKILAQTLWLTLSTILFINDKLGGLSFASIDLPKPSLLLIIVFYTLIFILFYIHRPSFRKAFVLILLLTLNIGIWQKVFAQSELKITCLDIPCGDATLIELPNSQNILINTGLRQNEILVQFLKSKGIRKIDLLVITNSHPDLWRGIELIGKDFRIDKAIIPNDSHSNILNCLTKDKTIALNSGEILKVNKLAEPALPRYRIQPVKFEIISAANKRQEPNTLALRIEYNNFSMFFIDNLNDLSAMPAFDENTVYSTDRLTVLKFSRLLSVRDKNWERILEIVRPKYIVISERWGTPLRLKELADKYDIKIYNLITEGGLTIAVTNGKVKLNKRNSFY